MGNNPYAQWGGTLAQSPSGSPQPQAGAPPASDPYAQWGGYSHTPTASRVTSNRPAAQPGAYQQAPGGEVHNAQTEAANPFTDTKTSVLPPMFGTQPQGALMKREDETDSQFLARAREAAKAVKPSAIEVEHRSNIARTLPTLGAAAAAPAAQLGVPIAAAEGAEALEGGKKVVDAAKKVYEWSKANPLKALAVGEVARELGIDPFTLTHKMIKYGKGLFGE